MKSRSPKQSYNEYVDIFLFVVTMLVANWVWKLSITGEETGQEVFLFGRDVSAPFLYMARCVADAVYWCVSLVRDTAFMSDDYAIRFENGVGTTIVWGCSGIKQMFIWLCVMLTTRGGWGHKLWFIPVGLLCCHAFNILRIALITLLIEHHPDWFPVLHDWVFKYLFYAMQFGLWVLFVEKIRPHASTH